MARTDYASTFLDVAPGERRQAEQLSEDTPFRIAILGDFSGHGNRRRKPIRVDLDNFDELPSRLETRLELPGPDGPICIAFGTIDDFHPDALYQNVPLFQQLRRARQEVLEDRPAPRRAPPPPVSESLPSALSSGSLLDDIVGGSETPAAARRKPDAWGQMIENIVQPHLAPQPSARQSELAGRVNETMHLAMRVFLHHPGFQALESNWRSIDFLLRRLETAEGIEISLIDLSKRELLDDPAAVRRLLADEQWAVIAGLYTFEAQAAEIRALGALAAIAQEAGAPFLSSIDPRILGCESFAEQPDPEDWTARLDAETEKEWTNLRALPEAGWIGLALPRFLVRQPYGKDSTDLQDFEEMTVPPDAADHLWANPAIACLTLIGESFLEDGWDVPLRNTMIGSLPVHTYKHDGEAQMTPCAECWMSERTTQRFLSRGIMPLASFKGRDAVKLIRLQSIAQPDSTLRGRWGGKA